MDCILIYDFGGQTCQLISRRIRELGVYSEIVPHNFDPTSYVPHQVKGIILSGSPYSVREPEAPLPNPKVFQLGLPVLGICYGLQVMAALFGGKVERLEKQEYGRAALYFQTSSLLFAGIPNGFISWMSHGDSVSMPPEGFQVVARSQEGIPAALEDSSRHWYGIQFHPEVTHCEYGTDILKNFAFFICKAKAEWSMASYLQMVRTELEKRVGTSKVLVLISGGVDSTVTGSLLLKCLNPDQVHLMYIDTGLMRKNETQEVEATLRTMGATHLHIIDAKERFLKALRGVEDPEKKRHIIGDQFIRVQEEEVHKLGISDAMLAQGTLYTDMIESGKGVGNKAQTIKSHHNVRSPLVEEKRAKGLIVEPLERLYKDEVRALGKELGLPESVISRHPFPGPGLGVRILGEVTEEKCNILREADAIYIEELRKRGLYDQIWQAFAVLLPIKSVGVLGDAREYRYVLALRAVVSKDGMTADVFDFPLKDLKEISSLITNTVPQVGRVVYDVSSKPPATI
ncbi:MAG: glutamine-hydrolyzing GMP synthase, partial [Spirochaetales bacterium]